MNVNEVFGVLAPTPVVESKLFNAARPTVTLLVEAGFDERFWRMYTAENTLVRQQGQGGRATAIRELDKAESHDDAKLLGFLMLILIEPRIGWSSALM